MTVILEQCSRLSTLEVEGTLRAPMDMTFRAQVEGLLRRGQRRIMLDLVHVRDIDAAGVGELMHAYRMARAAGGVVQITHPNGRVRQLLDVMGVLRLLTEAPERGAA